MAGVSFFAFLSRIEAMAKLAAVTMDDVAAQSFKTASKAAGIVIDDTATTPQYVSEFAPSREIPLLLRIAGGSLKNKAYITGALLGLSAGLGAVGIPLASVVIPTLALGGGYLCYEGYEKFFGHHGGEHTEEKRLLKPASPEAVTKQENERVSAAIRTDLVLSAEIMAFIFGDLTKFGLASQAAALAVAGTAMTVGVYGFVGLLVKADDIGLALSQSQTPITGPWRRLMRKFSKPVLPAPDLQPTLADKMFSKIAQPIGRGVVRGMPHLFKGLGVAGGVAMLWVGGAMVVHGLAHFGVTAPEHIMHAASTAAGHALPFASGLAEWAAGAVVSGALGLVVGSQSAVVIYAAKKIMPKKHAHAAPQPDMADPAFAEVNLPKNNKVAPQLTNTFENTQKPKAKVKKAPPYNPPNNGNKLN